MRFPDQTYRALLRMLRVGRSEEVSAIVADGRQLLADAQHEGRAAVVRLWVILFMDAVRTGVRLDVSHALRLMARAPGFTLTASLTLALGLTATTTMFVLVNGVLLRPLPYKEAQRVVMLWESNPSLSRPQDGPSPGNLLDLKERRGPFSHLAGWSTVKMTVRNGEGGIPVTASQVTDGFFDVFALSPVIGRTFSTLEYRGVAVSRGSFGGHEPTLVLSHRLWQELGGDPAAVGGMLDVDGRQWRVIGVMPRDFDMPHQSMLWIPWDPRAAYPPDRFPAGPPRDFRFLRAAARLSDGVTTESAGAWARTVGGQLASDFPAFNRDWAITLTPLSDFVLGRVSSGLVALFGAVALLLVLTAVNISSLMVARTLERTQELALRKALGASQLRVVRQLVIEAFLIAFLATLVSVLGTVLCLRGLIPFLPDSIPRLDELAVDFRVIMFSTALALLAASLGAGLTALLAHRSDLALVLKGSSARVTRSGAARLRGTLVVVEVALAVVLLVGAGLLVRSWVALHSVDPGFDPSNVVVLRVSADPRRYQGGQTAEYFRKVVTSLGELPSVQSVAAVTALPMSEVGANFRPFWPEGPRPDAPSVADVRMAMPEYFRTLRRPLDAGREFDQRDTQTSTRVVVVNESLATRTWGSHPPIGQRLVLDYLGGAYPYEVVGVTRDALYEGLRSEPRPEIFIPHAQNPYLLMNVIARTAVPAEDMLQAARAQVLSVDREQSVHSVTTLERLLDETLSTDRLALLLLTMFSVMGVVIAAAGVHALMTRTVVERRREIALRMALGASPETLMWSVLRESVSIGSLGVAFGVGAALAIGRVASSFLFGVMPYDPVTLVAVVAIIVAVTVMAAFLPARMAMRTDPMSILRS